MKNITLKKRDLAQYYTSTTLGEVLISMLPIDESVYDILDLSAGTGSLLMSAEKISPRSKLYGVDLDPDNVSFIKANSPNFIAFTGDSLESNGLSFLFERCRLFDFVLGNPPFKSVALNKEMQNEFESSFFINADKKIRAEVCFLAKGISLLKENAYLAYILPDGILTNSGFASLRKFLVNNFEVLEVREIPEGAFEGTEAKTHILIIRNIKPTYEKKIKLSTVVGNSTKFITHQNFIDRADHSYYTLPTPISCVKLSDVDIKLIRGKGGTIPDDRKFFLHTTSFNKSYTEFNGADFPFFRDPVRLEVAIKGDILIPRVGSRCIGKVGYVLSGQYFISDCIIIIRAAEEGCREKILSGLRSDFGIKWIKTVAKGVGAKHITLAELKNFPVI